MQFKSNCFTDCPDDLFNNMKMYCSKYIRVCKEININFMPLEAQVSTYMEEVHIMSHSFLLTRHYINCLTAHAHLGVHM